MATIVLYMNAMGLNFASEKCNGCGRCFDRGERMGAVEDSTGEPMGWFCDGCLEDWKKNGVKSKVFSQSERRCDK